VVKEVRMHVGNLYSSSDIIRVNKSRRSRCGGHVLSMGKMRNTYKILAGNL